MIENKKTTLFVLLCVSGLVIISSVFPFTAYADDFNPHPDPYFSVAPLSIPIEDTATGTVDVAMARFRWQALAGTTALKYVTVRLMADPSFDRSGITSIKVYFDNNQDIPTVPPTVSINEFFDRNAAPPGGDDVDVTVGSWDFTLSDTVKIEVDNTLAVKGTSGWAKIFIAFDLAPDAEIDESIGCEILEVEDNTGPPGNTHNPVASPAIDQDNIDDYETTLLATGIATPTGEQGEDFVPVLWLQLNSNDADFDVLDTYKNVNLDAITFHVIGTDFSDIDPGGISLWTDNIPYGTFDGSDVAIPSTVTPGAPSEYVTVNPSSPIPFDDTGINLIATVNVAESAGVGNTVGLEIEDPSTDLSFNDIIDDDDDSNVTVYAYVSVGTDYSQTGYILSSSTIPGTSNTFTVTPLPDTDPPQVAATVPRNNESGVVVTTDVTIIFNEDINPSTVSDTIFYVKDSTGSKVPGTVSASGSEAVFTPDSRFNYEQIYTATLEPGVEDIYGNAMTTTHTWGFATTPNVAKPVAANNRILPGSTDPVQIHIPEPSGGPSKRVTVQVFTTTGKKVATLINNRPYAQIENQLPLLWYGRNSRQQNLGPGLYFIQVISGGEKTILKVLIVR